MLQRMVRRKLFVLLCTVAIVGTALNILFAYLFLSRSLLEEKIVIIKPNSSINQITDKLHSKAVIRYKALFKVVAMMYNIRHPLKSGEYKFTANINPYQVLLKLSTGSSVVRRLYIPRSSTTDQIIQTIKNNKRLIGPVDENIPEGHLMPSTYFYSYGDRRQAIIELMLNNMSASLDEAMMLLSPKSPIKTRHELLILASIIEKEAGNEREKPIIASVFLNRLNQNMRLQADPTVIYAITKGKSKLNRKLARKDLAIDSPYNTYRISGLPPTPICAPSHSSIMAVVKPKKTKYLYFVTNGKGGHNFAQNLQQHNRNVAIFRTSCK